ncbi:MAG: T9SS type A sorting domain-containing protein [Flavobacteriales bacterium]|nr:T9SS type A sorting domain-containing protein [Flavobacteriales bacterium]
MNTYAGATHANPLNVHWIQDSTALYICSAFAGYTDGTTNDPQQRFVSRLLVSELTVGAVEQDTPPANSFSIHPNPTRSGTVFHYQLASDQGVGRIELRDISGRLVSTLPMPGAEGQQNVDTSALAPGTYLVLYLADNTLLHSGKLVVQQ